MSKGCGRLFKIGDGLSVVKRVLDSNKKHTTYYGESIEIVGENAKKLGKFAKVSLREAGNWVNLAKTKRFLPAMLLVGLIGYGLGNIGNKKDEDMGLVVEKTTLPEDENVSENIANMPEEETPVATYKENTVEDYYTIKTGGLTWKSIVENYYPKLIEQCNGAIYGTDGAIRVLKNELSKCGDVDLINAHDIPPTLHLPKNLNGVQINESEQISGQKIENFGGHTDIQEAGCKTSHSEFTVTDINTNQFYTGNDLNAAVDSLRARTSVPKYNITEAI